MQSILASQSTQNSAHSNQISTLQSTVDSQSTQISAQSDQISSLQSTSASQSTQISLQSKQLSGLQSSSSDLSSKVDEILPSDVQYTSQKISANTNSINDQAEDMHNHFVWLVVLTSLASRDREEAVTEAKEQEQKLAGYIATLTQSLTELIEAPADLTSNIKELQVLIKANKALVQFLDEAPPQCPLLAVVLPVSSLLFQDSDELTLRLFFVCSQTLQIVPSGKNGLGYIITKPMSWLKRASCLLLFSLVLVRFSFPATNLPYPCAGISVSAIEAAIEIIHPGLLKSITKPTGLLDFIQTFESGYVKSLQAIMEVVKEEDEAMLESRPRLVKHASGKHAWVWDLDDVEDSFRLDMTSISSVKDEFGMLRAMDAIATSFSASLSCDTENQVVKWNYRKTL